MSAYAYKQYNDKFTSTLSQSVRFNYILAEPTDRTPDEKLPMVIYLHGAGKRTEDVSVLKIYKGFIPMIDEGLPIRAVVLVPQITDGRYVWNNLVAPLKELIETMAEKHNVDFNKISITGQSMGGYGTWEMALTYPNFFSAAAPLCGGGMSWRAPALKNVPVRAFHGDKDPVVPYSTTIEMVDAINKSGGEAACIILHGLQHALGDFVYRQTNLLEWLVSKDLRNRGTEKYASWGVEIL